MTGSDSGIGRATAVAGMDVGVTWHTDRNGAEATASEVRGHGRRAVVMRLDAAEHGLGGLIKTIALEVGQHGITARSRP